MSTESLSPSSAPAPAPVEEAAPTAPSPSMSQDNKTSKDSALDASLPTPKPGAVFGLDDVKELLEKAQERSKKDKPLPDSPASSMQQLEGSMDSAAYPEPGSGAPNVPTPPPGVAEVAEVAQTVGPIVGA